MASPYPDVDEFWQLEGMGIMDNPSTNDDDEALNQFNSSVRMSNGRYSVKWPWKSNASDLPTNYELAVGRFRSLARRLKTTDSEILAKYQEVIQQQLENGIIEKIHVIESSNMVHYLPHHPVVKPSSATTKVRIVYDASAKSRKDKPCLNECLYRGPVLLPDLCEILIRFRLHPVAVVADIEKAFLQLDLQQSERDVTRFIWFNDVNSTAVDGNMTTYRFCRVPFGVISSPFLLGATIQYHLKQSKGWVPEKILSNIYVDNVICGVDDIESGHEFYRRAKSIFQAASMNLQEWCTNSDVLMQHIPDNDCVKRRTNKVLGLMWDSVNDTLTLNRSSTFRNSVGTKRDVMQSIASIYDPLGLFQPVTLQAKLFLQQLWRSNRNWDDALSSDEQEQWDIIHRAITPVSGITFPRHISCFDTQQQVTIAVFSDASIQAYAANVYLRVLRNGGSSWNCSLFSKSKLCPKKGDVSLPRLELLGLVIGARLAKFVRKALSLPSAKVYFFCDSMCVLHWIRSPKPLSVFVTNRVNELKGIDNSEYAHVLTADNPADFSTRGKSAEELMRSGMWWNGPTWLTTSHEDWPAPRDFGATAETLAEVDAECKGKRSLVFHPNLLAGEDPEAAEQITDGRCVGIDPENYSTLRKLLRVTAWCVKFIKKITWDRISVDTKQRLRCSALFDAVSSDPRISVSDLTHSGKLWVEFSQRSGYADLRKAVLEGKRHPMIDQLSVGIDADGILRCYGRFEHADLPLESIEPKLLPKKCHVTELIIRDVHERLFHCGVAHTLSQVRRDYWIPHGRNTVKKVLTRCVLCRKHKGPPFALPRMPPWPKERVSRSSPFQFTGVDYFGPINVKVNNVTQKMWVSLFTCLAVRAVHLECVDDFSAKSFLQCVIRFISRRGCPEQMISDNAPQFRVTKTACDRIWHSILKSDDITSYAASRGIQWKFTTELAPWQGGFYERLVGIVKNALKVGVGRRMLSWCELTTMATEVEAIVNSRPITYVGAEFGARPALRPVDFLCDRPVGMPQTEPGMKLEGGDAGKNLLRYWKLKEGRLNALWAQWHDDYLLGLRERGSKLHKRRPGDICDVPDVGSIVIVKEADVPRGSWKLARVEAIITSGDGVVRSASVRLPNGYAIRRSINHLYPMEVNAAEVENDDFEGFTEEEVDEAQNRAEILRGRDDLATGLAAVAFTLDF